VKVPTKSAISRYMVQVTLEAPLRFVFRWCTDYSSGDGRDSGEGYERRVLQRSVESVDLEDLYDTNSGWIWIHRAVSLHPPDRWHADSVGSDRTLSVDYRLSTGEAGHTHLSIRAVRRPYGTGLANPPKSAWEDSVSKSWARLARVLERDYQNSKPKRTKREGRL
jgi:hypothetical protein